MLRRFKGFGLSLLAAGSLFLGLSACNNNSVPDENIPSDNVVCDVNPAVEYAESLGYSNSEVFSPLGEDCDIGDYSSGSSYDRVTIDFLVRMYDEGEISSGSIGDIVSFIGEKVSKVDWSILNFSVDVYRLQKNAGLIPNDSLFTFSNITPFRYPEDASLSQGVISLDSAGPASFTEIFIVEGQGGYNFMKGLLTPDSDSDCDTLVENEGQGLDKLYMINSNDVVRASLPLFSDMKVYFVYDEGTLRDPKGTQSVTFELLESGSFYSSLSFKYYGAGHIAKDESNGVRSFFEVGDEVKAPYYDKNGVFHEGDLYVIGTIFTDPNSDFKKIDFDSNHMTSNTLFSGYDLGNGVKMFSPFRPDVVRYLTFGGFNTYSFNIPIYSSDHTIVVGYNISGYTLSTYNPLDSSYCKYNLE